MSWNKSLQVMEEVIIGHGTGYYMSWKRLLLVMEETIAGQGRGHCWSCWGLSQVI